jgi:hypothetical protein
MSETGLKARETAWFKVDNKSDLGGEREKESFENEGTKLECL